MSKFVEICENLKNLKNKLCDAAIRGIEFVKENPETCGILATVGTTLIGGGVKLTKGIIRTHRIHKEQYLKERYIYDRSLGMYLKTRRPLRNNDYIIINRRRRNGERLSDILAGMGLLS